MRLNLKSFLLVVGAVTIVSVILINSNLVEAQSSPHATLTWNGTQTCLDCHSTQAYGVFNSAHYQWQGSAKYMVNGAASQGKISTSVNSYCVNILGNWGCGSCHAGLGKQPSTDFSQAEIENVDCMMCHQKEYKRVKDATTGLFVPDTTKMTITMDQAARTVHKPVRANCIQCHAKGGGGDNFKRGDLALAHGTTTDANFDFHMAATNGKNLSCQSCHLTSQHKISGRGSDLRQVDYDVKVECSNCHLAKTNLKSGHSTYDSSHHVGRVACQSCHIPTYAKNASDTTATEATETHRDWSVPEWSTANNRWEPTPTLANNLIPKYKFWNGTSWGYSKGDIVTTNPETGNFQTSRPVGSINDPASKLYPFKYKTANQPYATNQRKLIMIDTKKFFSTGDYNSATQSGLVNMGYSASEPYTIATTDTYQLITHETAKKTKVLTCTKCHTSSATQMKLKKDLGYTIKAAYTTTCKQCHSVKNPSSMSYTKMHNEHVKGENIDCSMCHSFTRAAERGLKVGIVKD